jgi:hypothetical protein
MKAGASTPGCGPSSVNSPSRTIWSPVARTVVPEAAPLSEVIVQLPSTSMRSSTAMT